MIEKITPSELFLNLLSIFISNETQFEIVNFGRYCGPATIKEMQEKCRKNGEHFYLFKSRDKGKGGKKCWRQIVWDQKEVEIRIQISGKFAQLQNEEII